MRQEVVIVDDEPPARRKLARLLEPHADLRLAGEAAGVQAAIAVVSELRPALLLLDVQLPDGTGFDVLEGLPADLRPHTIFVTAFDHYAVKAFEVRALDYLMKPVSQARLNAALGRAREAMRTDAASRYRSRILVRDEGIAYFVEAAAIDWIEAARNYVVVHAGGATHIVRATIEKLAAELDPDRFARVSRSAVVNVRRVKAWSRTPGCAEIVLVNGAAIKCGRQYFREALARWTQAP